MSPPAQPIIDVRGVSAGYGDRLVLRNITFQVYEGEVFLIIGRSGSGKSTLLKHLIGLNPPLAGEIFIEGKNLVAASPGERQRLLRSFGVLYQSGALFGSMSILENVRLPLDEFTDLPDIAKELVALSKLKLVGLAAAAQAMPSQLSGGMQKRAAIARAMSLDPRILFLDEPSVGLDPITAAGLDELVLELSRSFGITFVIVTHELASMYEVGARLIMVGGPEKTIIAEGKPAELRNHAADDEVRRFFNRQPEPDPWSHQTQVA